MGALVVHQLAYLLVYPVAAVRADALADHSHLSLQWALVTPTAVIAASTLVLLQVRSLELGRQLGRRRLGGLTGAMFLGQEIVEAQLNGENPLLVLTHPAAMIGVILAPLVALVITLVLGEASELVARFLRSPLPVAAIRSASVPRPKAVLAPRGRGFTCAPSRGPPRVRC